VRQLAHQGPDAREILARSLLTPACGMGYLSPEAATRVLALLADLSARGRGWLATL